MAGIYLHIPFCKQACHYCNFHFSTSLNLKNDLLKALLKEIELQKPYLKSEKIKTIYFGGGTPSLLKADEIKTIIDQIHVFHEVDSEAEITLETNPDDLTDAVIQELKDSPVNRLSIGIQSFIQADLEWMNRAHNADQALQSILTAQAAGFDNMTIDLIYGVPSLTDELWLQNLETFKKLDIPHLSAYCLTVEPQTALANFIEKGKLPPLNEEKARNQMILLMDFVENNGYEQYEISNFAKKGFYSKHNSSYWLGENYLGLGPAAHSFNGQTRQWNIANNAKYIKSIEANTVPFEIENLKLSDQINEYLMVSLRTSWGADKSKIEEKFGRKAWADILEMASPFLENKELVHQLDKLFLSKKGRLRADHIAAMLFFEDTDD